MWAASQSSLSEREWELRHSLAKKAILTRMTITFIPCLAPESQQVSSCFPPGSLERIDTTCPPYSVLGLVCPCCRLRHRRTLTRRSSSFWSLCLSRLCRSLFGASRHEVHNFCRTGPPSKIFVTVLDFCKRCQTHNLSLDVITYLNELIIITRYLTGVLGIYKFLSWPASVIKIITSTASFFLEIWLKRSPYFIKRNTWQAQVSSKRSLSWD